MDEYNSGFLDRVYEGDQLATLLPDLLWSDEGLDVGDERNFSVQIHHTYEESHIKLHMAKQRCDRDYIGV